MMQTSKNLTTDSQPHLAMQQKQEGVYIQKKCVCEKQFKNERSLYIDCIAFRDFVEEREGRTKGKRVEREFVVGALLGISKAGVLHSLVTAC